SVNIFASTASQRAAVIEHFQEQWADHLSSAIIGGLRRNAQPSDGHLPLLTLIDSIDLGMQWALGSEKAPKDFKFGYAFFPVNRVLHGKLRQSTPAETLAHVEGSLMSLRAEQRLDFWHAVIDVMQLSIAPTP